MWHVQIEKYPFSNHRPSGFQFLPVRILGYGEGIAFIPYFKSSHSVGNHILFVLPPNHLSDPSSYIYLHGYLLSLGLFLFPLNNPMTPLQVLLPPVSSLSIFPYYMAIVILIKWPYNVFAFDLIYLKYSVCLPEWLSHSPWHGLQSSCFGLPVLVQLYPVKSNGLVSVCTLIDISNSIWDC